ncbi:MAG: hypothetical protein HRT93_09245 [Piscirickettsiaceae bacterium]|nr:hypothetical protein [Piscirickettsiaceae bacterium]
MKTLLSSMVVAVVLLTACGENTDTSVNEEQIIPQVVQETTAVEVEQETSAEQNMDKLSFYASRNTTVTAKVEAINHETREVALLHEDGSKLSFVVSEEARNLAQVQAGDVIIANYIENMSIELISVENGEAGAGIITGVGRAEEGEMPGGIQSETIVVTATVEDINIEANTFKLKGPQGNVKEFTARNPENLKKASVGDLVVITHTKAMALKVEKVK